MALLDLLHVQRSGFFQFLKLGIDKELSQLNLNVENISLQVVPFFNDLSAYRTYDVMDLIEPSREDRKKACTQKEAKGTSKVHSLHMMTATFGRTASLCVPYLRLNKMQLLTTNQRSLKAESQHLAIKYGKTKVPTLLQDKHINKLKLRMQSKKNRTISFTPTEGSLPLAKSNAFKNLSNNYLLSVKNQNSCFRLIASKYTPREAILYQKSWSCKLVVKVLLTVHEKRVSPKENLAKLLTSTSEALAWHPKVSTAQDSDKSKISIGRKTTFYASQPDRSTNTTRLDSNQKRFLKVKNSTSQLKLQLGGTTEGNQKLRLVPQPRASLRTIPSLSATTFGRSVEPRQDSLVVQKLPTVNHELFLVLGELPLMTKRGHFIIHGSPRVILSQLIRKPGIYFIQKNNELQADCIPEQGPWFCIYKNLRDESISTTSEARSEVIGVAQKQETQPSYASTFDRASLPSLSAITTFGLGSTLRPKVVSKDQEARPEISTTPVVSNVELSAWQDLPVRSFAQTQASYFCYTKQFSSMPFSVVYSTFRVFELHSQFTDQTLLLTKLKTLEKIRKFKDVITTLLTFTWKKRIRKRLQRLYTKQCFTSTQQFEKTKVLFRLKKKLILGASSRKSFNEKLGISSCVNTGITQNVFDNNFFDTSFNKSLIHLSSAQSTFYADLMQSIEGKFATSEAHRSAQLSDPLPPLPSLLATRIKDSSSIESKISNQLNIINSTHYLSNFCTSEALTNQRFVDAQRRTKTEGSYERSSSYRSRLTQGGSSGFASYKLPSMLLLPSVLGTKKLILGRNVAKQPKELNSSLSKGEIGVAENENKTLLSRDLALIVSFLNGSKILESDDIDDLNNQRIRTPSDQVQQQVRIGFFRFKKMLAKLISSGGTSQTLTDFLNGALREFFGGNPLSQFLDQTNPLAEITHKRRVSKLGTGGIQRESATLKVRTIHSTYFGRICPIETPEGVNAGLVNSLTCLSRVDQRGQLVTPLSPLIEGQKQEQFFYYSNKENSALSTTDTALLKFHRLPNQFIYTKNESQFQQIEPNKVKLRVKSDLQTISLATALIPFLAYDDANRALMGSNMQRQAVPLILPERPMVRTGMESLVINESGHSFESSSGGFVSYISAQYVVILCNTLNKRLLI